MTEPYSAAARAAFRTGPWAGASVAERQRALHAIHEAILEHAEELAALGCVEGDYILLQPARDTVSVRP